MSESATAMRPSDAPKSGMPTSHVDAAPWRRLSRFERIIVCIAMAVLIATGLPRVAPGVCFGDPGDFQVAAAGFGIMHPPGYVGYAGLFGLLGKALFFLDPAYAVNLICFACMAGSLLLITLLLVRLGLHVLISTAFALALTTTPHAWLSMTIPEIYAPSLLLLVSSVYLLVRYERLALPRDLYLASTLFGLLAINRPPALMYALGFIAAIIVIQRRRPVSGLIRPVALATACAAVPMLATVAYGLTRDVPTTEYNYITQFSSGVDVIPGTTERATLDLTERWTRLRWLMSGQQFAGTFGTTLTQATSKLLWLRQRFGLDGDIACVLAICLLIVGAVRLGRTSPAAGTSAGWIAISVVAYLIVYRIHGQAADLLPLLFAAALMVGAALAVVFPAGRGPRWLAVVVFICAIAATGYHNATREVNLAKYDARGMLTDIDLATLPPGAAIVGEFDLLRPLWYARCVTRPRDDIELVTLRATDPIPAWLIERGAPIYTVEQTEDGVPGNAGSGQEDGRAVWRVVPCQRAVGASRGETTGS